jgi:hypothetical protein
METIRLKLEDAAAQSLRNCNALSLIMLGQTREMGQDAIARVKGFIQKYMP